MVEDILYPLIGRKLYFLHIPKTAGTSVAAMLQQIASAHRLNFHGPLLIDHLRSIPQWENSDILAGHLGRLPLKSGFEFFTLLRNPIERLYSYYSHVQRDKNHYFHDIVCDERMSFEEWLLDPRLKKLNFNMQTRFLSTGAKVPKGESGPKEWQLQKNFENQECHKLKLGTAIKTLNMALWLGTPDHLDSLCSFLSYQYNFHNLSIPTLNVNLEPRKKFTLNEIAAAAPMVKFDQVLFDIAISRAENPIS